MAHGWIFLFYSNFACLLVVLLVPKELLVLRTFATVLLSVGGIWNYLYQKYGRQLSLKIDVLTSFGITIQFLLPSLYLCSFTASGYWQGVLLYRDYYPYVAFITLLGQSLFFLGYEFFQRRPSKSLKLDHYFLFPKFNLLFILPLVFAVWSSRFILLYTGSYYHLVRTEFMSHSFWYSVLAQINSYGIFCLTSFWIFRWLAQGTYLHRYYRFLSFGFTLMECMWYFPSGSREPILMTGLSILFSYIFIKHKIPFKWLIAGIPAGMLLISGLDFYRYSIASIVEPNVIKTNEVYEAIATAKYGFLQDLISGNWITRSISRISDAQSIAAILDGVPQVVPYLNGETYARIPFVFIPRFIYPDKPELILPINRWFFLEAGGSSPTTLIGEAYLNFGWLGVFLVMPIMGWISKIYDVLFERRINDPIWAAIYVGMAVIIVRLPVQPVAIWISIFLKAMLLATLLVFWRQLLKRSKI